MNPQLLADLNALRQVQWQSLDNFQFPSQMAQRWLSEQGSLSHLMAQYCHQLSVELLENRMITPEQLKKQELELLEGENCLQRQVILKGDQTPWVLAHTLIPESSLQMPDHDFNQQGDVPLGVTIFQSPDAKRDALQVGWAETSQGRQLARRSRLWMNHKPILVAELFLLSSPVYPKENN